MQRPSFLIDDILGNNNTKNNNNDVNNDDNNNDNNNDSVIGRSYDLKRQTEFFRCFQTASPTTTREEDDDRWTITSSEDAGSNLSQCDTRRVALSLSALSPSALSPSAMSSVESGFVGEGCYDNDDSSLDSIDGDESTPKPSSAEMEDVTKSSSRKKKPRLARTIFTDIQIASLEDNFQRRRYITPHDRMKLARELKLGDAQVKTWYQNRRTKWKREIVTKNAASPRHLPAEVMSKNTPDRNCSCSSCNSINCSSSSCGCTGYSSLTSLLNLLASYHPTVTMMMLGAAAQGSPSNELL